MDILMINHFTQVPGEDGNGRFDYLAKLICSSNNEVEIITSSFSHRTKCQRRITLQQLQALPYKLTLLYEPGYKTNVCLKRFYSHWIFGKSLKKYLANRKKTDIVYCSVPSLDVAYVAAQYAKKNGIKFIIDIQDLWPEAFKMVFDVPFISNIAYYPMQKRANFIYNSADEIIAVSNTYVQRALNVNHKVQKGYCIFLGTDLSYFDQLKEVNKIIRNDKEFWIAYIGTLGSSYDIKCVIDAIHILQDSGIHNIRFIIMGDGPLKNKFENYALEKHITTTFTGRLAYGKMVGLLSACDIAVNPIKKGSVATIINKVGDYAAAGKAVISTQECQEYRNLIDKYKCGINCNVGNAKEVANAILKFINDDDLLQQMGSNNRKFAEEKFDRKKTYQKILSLLIEH